MKKCEKCGSRQHPTEHHVRPKLFYGRQGLTITLCCCCHRRIENIICAIEHHRSGLPYGQRFKLPGDEYDFIANNFCRKELVCMDSSRY